MTKKENVESEEQTDDISNQKLDRRKSLIGGTERKTTAIELMAPDKIDGYGNNKGKEHRVYDQCGGTGVDAQNQGEPCKKLKERQDNGNQIDGKIRKKVIPVNYFCKTSRIDNLVIARKDKHKSE